MPTTVGSSDADEALLSRLVSALSISSKFGSDMDMPPMEAYTDWLLVLLLQRSLQESLKIQEDILELIYRSKKLEELALARTVVIAPY